MSGSFTPSHASASRRGSWIFAAVSFFAAIFFPAFVEAQSTANTLFGSFNGFNNHTVVLECSNADDQAVTLIVNLFHNNGSAIGSQRRTIAANGTEHIVLNSFASTSVNPIADDYGLIVLRAEDLSSLSDVRCIAAHYRLTGENRVEYAYAIPVQAPLTGTTYGIYNSIDPSGLGRAPTQNWLTIFNPSSSQTFVASVTRYQDGQSSPETSQISLQPYQRLDLPLAFQTGQQLAGTYRVTPASSSQAYGAFLTRYFSPDGRNFDFAFYLGNLKGTCGTRVPVSTMANADNWLEIANPGSATVPLKVVLTDASGRIVFQDNQSFRLAAGAQRHIYINQYLDANGQGNVGSVKVSCDNANDKLLYQSAYYGHPSANDHNVSWAYVSQAEAIQPVGNEDRLLTFANTFLGAANWLKLTNEAPGSIALATSVLSTAGNASSALNVQIAANGSSDVAIHERVGQNFAGAISVEGSASDSSFSGELLRVYLNQQGNIDYIMPVPAAVITASAKDDRGVCQVPTQCQVGAPLANISWTLTPSTSANNPTKRNIGIAKISAAVACAEMYKIERLNSNGTVATDSNFPYWTGSLETAFSLTGNWGGSGTFYYRVSAWSTHEDDGGHRVSNYSSTLPVYYNHDFQNLQFDISVDCTSSGTPGLCTLTANPRDTTLAQQAVLYSWVETKPVLDASGNPTYVEDGGVRYPRFVDDLNTYEWSSTPKYVASLPTCGVRYFRLYGAWNGLNGHNGVRQLASGINSIGAPTVGTHYTSMPIAIVQRNSANSCPNLNTVSGHLAQYVYQGRSIPGTFRLPLVRNQITVFSGGVNWLPLGGSNPTYIEVQLPSDIALAPFIQTVGGGYGYSVTNITVTDGTLPSGYKRYRLAKTSSLCATNGCSWSYLDRAVNLFPVFLNSTVVGRAGMQLKVRALANTSEASRSDNWQTMALTAKNIPSITAPRRLITGVSWANQDLFPNSVTTGFPSQNFNNLSTNAKLGFNSIGLSSTQYFNPATNAALYFPNRNGTEWDNLIFGPEHSTLEGRYDDEGVISRLRAPLQSVLSFDFATLGLNSQQAATERQKWLNAARFHDGSDGDFFDFAYDGVFFERALKNLADTVRAGKPEILYLDIEDLPTSEWWEENVLRSQNALRRRNACETRHHLAARMADEFLGRIVSTIHSISPGTAIGYYGSFPDYNQGYRLITGDLMKKYGIIQQPNYYGEPANLRDFAAAVQSNRAALPQGSLLLPWLSTGCYGYMSPKQTFDMLAHTLASGANGFSIYEPTNFEDGAQWLAFNEILGMLSADEDVIMDGVSAMSDITNVSNAIISAMKKNGRYLIAVTPINPASPVVFSVAAPSGVRTLKNLRSNTTQTLSSGAVNLSITLSDTTVYRLASS